MTVKCMRKVLPLVIAACLVMTAGAKLTALPESSHYSGISYFNFSPAAGKIQTGRIEFAVYDTQTNPNEFVGNDGYTNPGNGRYVYAYQIFNSAFNDYGMTNTSIPVLTIKTLGINSVLSNDDIDTADDNPNSNNGVDATSYSLTPSGTSLVFAFDEGILAAGKNSWFLLLSSNQNWKKGDYDFKVPDDSDIVVPDTTEDQNSDDNNTTPEPATLLLMTLGAAVTMFKRK